MRSNHSSAFLTSLTLHGAIAALFVFVTYYSVWQQGPKPVIFELVAGPPTAPDELVAPALGNSLTPVKQPTPDAKVEVPQEKPEPKIEETVKTVETHPPSDAIPPPPKPKADKTLLRELKKHELISKKKWDKEHPTPKPTPQTAAAQPRAGHVPRLDIEGITQGVSGGSTANKRGGGGGKAMTQEEHDEFSTYCSLVGNAVHDAYVPPPGVNDNLMVYITVDITASGAILNPRIKKSSGSRAYDESV